MKVASIAALLLADAVLATPAVDKRQFGNPMSIVCALARGDTAILGATGNPSTSGREGAKPSGTIAPEKDEKGVPTVQVEGLKVRQIKIRTGPYTAPGMLKKNSYSKLAGMLESYYDPDVNKPCSNCNILRQVGGLEYADGTNANIDSGLWLHHMVHFNNGPRRWDPVGVNGACGGCVPMDGINMPDIRGVNKAKLLMAKEPASSEAISAQNTERYFVTGNERTPFNFYTPETKSAYHLDAADKFFYLVELMNMNDQDAIVYITMTYDVIDGALPSGWSDVKTVFLDANSCSSSEVGSIEGRTTFTIPDPSVKGQPKPSPWKPNIKGKIIDSLGHLHDGGTQIDIIASSSGDMLCNTTAVYSQKPEFVYKKYGMAMNGDKPAKDHISNMNGCGSNDKRIAEMHPKQSWLVKGHYDYNVHEPNLVASKPGEVMAIAIVLVAVQPTPGKLPRVS